MGNVIEFPNQTDSDDKSNEVLLIKRRDLERIIKNALKEVQGMSYSMGYRSGYIDAMINLGGGFNGNTD